MRSLPTTGSGLRAMARSRRRARHRGPSGRSGSTRARGRSRASRGPVTAIGSTATRSSNSSATAYRASLMGWLIVVGLGVLLLLDLVILAGQLPKPDSREWAVLALLALLFALAMAVALGALLDRLTR